MEVATRADNRGLLWLTVAYFAVVAVLFVQSLA